MKSGDAFRLNVKDLMGRQGLKVKDLADMVGLSPSYLSLILNGERANLSDHHKDAIALALGASLADLYTEMPRDEAEAASRRGSAETAEARVEPAPLLRRKRDIAPFEDFLRVMSVTDHLLLEAFYRELNSLSDEEVRKLGAMLRNTLSSWQEAAARRVPAPAGPSGTGAVPAAPPVVLEPDDRMFLWLLIHLSSIFDEVPLAYLAMATSWPAERVHRALATLLSAGAAIVVSGGAGASPRAGASAREVPGDDAGGGSILLKPSVQLDAGAAAQWVPAGRRRESLLNLACGLGGTGEDGTVEPGGVSDAAGSRPDRLARLYLEGGDLRKARSWYEQAAVRALSDGMWRVAKDHLLVVCSLDTVLGTPSEDRVSAVQMLATTCLNLGETDEALAYQERNIAYWERSGSSTDVVRGLLMAGSILARRREWAKALDYLGRALGVSHGDLSLEARARLGLAAILRERGQLSRTKEEYERALQLSGDVQEESMMAQALLGLGKVFLWRRDFMRSLQYLNRALSLSEKKEAALETLVRIELGKLRFEEGSFLLAREHLTKAAHAAETARSPETENAAKVWLSRCLGQGAAPSDLENKRRLAYAAREFFAGIDDKQGLVASLIACAEAEDAVDMPAEADALFRDALREARESENPVLEGMACDAYAGHLEQQADDLAQVMRERARWARAKIR